MWPRTLGRQMSDADIDLIGKIAPGVISALVASWIAVRLAFARYKKEVLWERKLDAYTRILEALHVSRLHSEQARDEALTGQEYSKEYKAELQKRELGAWSELQKVFDVGSLIICEEATAYLREKLKPRYEAWQNDPAFEFWEKEEQIAHEAIVHIKVLAQKDLKR